MRIYILESSIPDEAGMSLGRVSHLRSDAPWTATIGRCIYCGSTIGLTKEHVIPYGLGGDILLLKASCRDCKDVIDKFETRIIKHDWKMHRAHDNVRTRNEHPIAGAVIVAEARPAGLGPGLAPELRDGKDADLDPGQSKIQVPLDEHPHILIMPIISGRPAILTGSNDPWSEFRFPFHDRVETARRFALHGEHVAVDTPFHMDAFLRLLAKIAHGMLFAEFEMAGIRPLLLNIIKEGETEEAWRLIGQEPFVVRYNPFTRMISEGGGRPTGPIVQTTVEQAPDGRIVIVVRIRLFSEYGAPTYVVVAGESDTLPNFRPERRSSAKGPASERTSLDKLDQRSHINPPRL
jgi:hypothetical protein